MESVAEFDKLNMDIKKLPDLVGNMKYLKVLQMRFSVIRTITSSVWKQEKLEKSYDETSIPQLVPL